MLYFFINGIFFAFIKKTKKINMSGIIKMKKMVAIDLFCGAGGLTRGFLDAGIEVLAGVDFDSDAKKTYEYNNKVPYIQEDIRNITAKKIKEIFAQSKDCIKILAGCAPCQPFSSINKKE
ncbi:DNA cytosine methyltransferase, partial [uncultured Helicobacter sp.]|uniref:DNA cytosine methyltransferase n=1 Tax=uncultured Helicobacter sp. TaxID=175537 RepID=UPI002601DB08